MKEILIGGAAYVGLVALFCYLNHRFWKHTCPYSDYEIEQQDKEQMEALNEIP